MRALAQIPTVVRQLPKALKIRTLLGTSYYKAKGRSKTNSNQYFWAYKTNTNGNSVATTTAGLCKT